MKPTSSANRRHSSAQAAGNAKGRQATAPTSRLVPARLKIANILVPIDFSSHSEKALRYALGLAGQFGAELTLVHVVEQIFYPNDWVHPLTPVDFPKRCQELTQRLEALAAAHQTTVHPVVLLGRPWEEIVELAKKRKADLVVIGTHGYTGLKHALVGSVAEKVVRHAPCPVLTIRADERDFL